MLKKGKWTVPGTYFRFRFVVLLFIPRLRIQGEVWRSQRDVDLRTTLEALIASPVFYFRLLKSVYWRKRLDMCEKQGRVFETKALLMQSHSRILAWFFGTF